MLTLRSDHVAGLVGDPEFAALAERGMHLVVPLVGERLRSSIEGPARVAGLKLEPGLVDLLLRDAADEPGALPLLSHALAETWRKREGYVLTVEGYRATGGISGAVAASADRLHASLSDEGRSQLRWLMLRMAGLSEQGEPVRTPVDRSLATDGEERGRVVDLLVRARLVTTAEGSIELAHEALVRAWPRLRGWLEEDREGQRVWRHLAVSSAEWERLGRPDSELYAGVRLAAAREWAARPDSQPAPVEREFLDRSVDHAEAEQHTLQQQARHERRQNRRLRGLLVGVALALVAALVAALLAVDQGRTAATERDAARESREAAVHEALVSRSLSLRSTNRAAAAILAVEAWQRHGDALSESALVGTFTDAPGFLGNGSTPYDVVQGAPIPGTRHAVIASGNRMHVADLDTGELGPLFRHPVADNDNQQVLRVSGDGRRVAQLLFDPAQTDICGHYERLVADDGRGCTLLTVFDIETGRPVLGPVPTPFQGGDLAIDHRGDVVAVTGGFDGDLATYDVDRGIRLGTLSGLPRPGRRLQLARHRRRGLRQRGEALPGLDERAGPRRRPGDAPGAAAVRGATAVDAQLPDRDPGRSPGRGRGLFHRRDQGDHRSGGVARQDVKRPQRRLALPGGGGGRQARAPLLRQPGRRDRGAEPADGPAHRCQSGPSAGGGRRPRDRARQRAGLVLGRDPAMAAGRERSGVAADRPRRLHGRRVRRLGPVARPRRGWVLWPAPGDRRGDRIRVGTLEVEGEATWVGEGVMALFGDWGLELGTVGAGLTQPEDPVLRRAESVFPATPPTGPGRRPCPGSRRFRAARVRRRFGHHDRTRGPDSRRAHAAAQHRCGQDAARRLPHLEHAAVLRLRRPLPRCSLRGRRRP